MDVELGAEEKSLLDSVKEIWKNGKNLTGWVDATARHGAKAEGGGVDSYLLDRIVFKSRTMAAMQDDIFVIF